MTQPAATDEDAIVAEEMALFRKAQRVTGQV